ncbi:MAG: heme exporter protein CcmB [Planctomycetaceae bacterium]
MQFLNAGRAWWWLVHKDLQREWHAPRAWPGMLLLAVVLAALLEMQIDLPHDRHMQVIAGLFWLIAFFAGTLALDRSFSGEQEHGCWPALLMYPVPPGVIFLAKITVNFLSLCIVDAVLAIALVLFSGEPLFPRPVLFVVVLMLANVGFAAVGTVLGALTSGLQQRSGMLVLLLLPLISPVVLAAAEATRLILLTDSAEWRRWGELLACFAVTFVCLGTLLFEFVIEE